MKKKLLLKDFEASIEQIKLLFEAKLNEFIEEMARFSISETLLTKNQENFNNITSNLTKILDNFEIIERNLKKTPLPKPRYSLSQAPITTTIKSQNIPPPLNNKPLESTLINSPLLLNRKTNDNLADLQRKSSITSFSRARAVTTSKNLRNETFAKIYLSELYYKSKEIIKKQKL